MTEESLLNEQKSSKIRSIMDNKISEEKLDEKRVVIFKTLADPIRIKIIRYLKKMSREMNCGEIGEAIGISKSSGSYHFKLLQEAELITARKQAREKFVALNVDTFDKYVTGFFKSI